ncbi:MAG: hypothetical protein ACYDHB_13235 [Candidatus Dormibacteria bacterium]
MTLGVAVAALLLASCAPAPPSSLASARPLPATLMSGPGPCHNLVLPQTMVIRRETGNGAAATGFPMTNVSPFVRSIRSTTLTRQLFASACAVVGQKCVTMTILPATTLNGYTIAFYAHGISVATVVGTPAAPCGTLFLNKRTNSHSLQAEEAPFLIPGPGWIDVSDNAQAFFSKLATTLNVLRSSLTS